MPWEENLCKFNLQKTTGKVMQLSKDVYEQIGRGEVIAEERGDGMVLIVVTGLFEKS